MLGTLFKFAWFGVIGFAFYWFFWLPRQEEKAAEKARANAQAQAPPQAAPFTPDASQSVELATAASIHRQQLTAAKFKQRQAIAAYDELTRDLEAWERELIAWQNEAPPLLKSDEGKRIAVDAALTRRFRAVFNQERPSGEALAAARRQAEELISPVRESLANAEDAAPPSEDIVSTVRELQTQARSSRERYRQARDAVKAMFIGAPDPGAKTLEQAITQVDHEETLERLAIVEAEAKKAREAGTRLIAEEKVKLISTESEAEAQRLRDEAARKKQASDLAAAKTVEEMELRQKESATEIERLRDAAELKRQGALTTGSVWKGKSYRAALVDEATLTVISHDKDTMQVRLHYIQPYLGTTSNTYSSTFQGTIQGNTLRLKPVDVSTTTHNIEATYHPASQTITGNYTTDAGTAGTFKVQLHKGD